MDVTPVPAAAATAAGLHAGPVLVVEDQPLIRRAWAEWLTSDGWTVIEAASADEALTAAAAQPPAVVICDVSLGGGKSGMWVANQLLASSAAPQVIYATSHDQLPADATLRHGVSAYLLKPFGRRGLMSAVGAAESEVVSRRQRMSADQAYRDEMAARRAHLYARISRLEPWELANASAISARLNPFKLHEREASLAGLAERASAQLGLTAPERLSLMRAIELRNLGKLEMPDALLHQARPLASSERRLLSSYVVESAAAIARCGFDQAAAWAGAIGDRWDGLDGAAATPEPTAGHGPGLTRVLAVYLALLEPRAYRTAFHSSDAVEHLRRGAGTLYSPAAVDALTATLAVRRI